MMVYVILIQLKWCFLSQLALTKGIQNTQLVELKSYSITSLKKSYTCINYPHLILCQSDLGVGGEGKILNYPQNCSLKTDTVLANTCTNISFRKNFKENISAVMTKLRRW